MTCDFTSFSTVFQSYQEDESIIMKGCVQEGQLSVTGGKYVHLVLVNSLGGLSLPRNSVVR